MNFFKQFSRQQITKAAIFISLFLLTYFVVIGVYLKESTRGVADLATPDPGADYIEVSVNVVGIDPVKGDMTARIQFKPQGSFAVADSNKVGSAVKFEVNTSTGKPERVFEKGKVMEPTDVVIPLFDGQVNDYPFDRHSSFLEMSMTSTTTPPQDIPMKVNFYSAVAGYSSGVTLDKDSSTSYVALDISVKRSITTMLFSVFIMVGMWLVGLIVLIQSQIVRGKGKMVETNMFTYMAALIFALPAVRNIQPGIPPVGTLSDFLAFFWVEGLATVSFITIAYCWLTRYGKQ